MNLYEESSVELWTETPPIPAVAQETVHTCVLFVAMATSGSCSTDQANNCAIIIACSADIHFCSVLFWTSPLCHGGTFNTVSANSKPYVYRIWCVIAWVFFPQRSSEITTPLCLHRCPLPLCWRTSSWAMMHYPCLSGHPEASDVLLVDGGRQSSFSLSIYAHYRMDIWNQLCSLCWVERLAGC